VVDGESAWSSDSPFRVQQRDDTAMTALNLLRGVMDVKVIKADVGKTFPADDQKSPDIARLMIAANAIRSLQRVFLRVNSDHYDQEVGLQVAAGDRLVIYLLTIGILKEAMDAFRTLDSQGWFANKIGGDILKRIGKACDKNDDSSMYTRVTKPLRDEVAFHWKRHEIQAALCCLPKGTPQDIFVSYSGKGIDSRYSLADEILVNISSRDRIMMEETTQSPPKEFPTTGEQPDICKAAPQRSEIDLKAIINEIVNFSGDFHELVDTCLHSHLIEKGAVLEERN